MAKYKPGQLVTFGRYIYRIRKGIHNGGCIMCIINHLMKDVDYPQFCIQSQKNPAMYEHPARVEHNITMCRELLSEDLFPDFVKINPLCVKN